MAAKQKLIVTVDSSFEQIVECDKNGGAVIFDPKRFKVLTPAEVEQLSAQSRQRYFMTKELVDEALIDEPVADVANMVNARERAALIDTGYGLKLSADAGSASDRLRFEVPKGQRESDYYYARAEDVDDNVARGSSVVQTGVKSWGNKGNGVHRITRRGNDELILMFKENRVAIESADVEKRYNERVNANTSDHETLAKRVSGADFVAKRDDKFRDIE